MDLRLLDADPTAAERAAVDAVVGPPMSRFDGGASNGADGRVARGGHRQRSRRHLLLPALHAVRDTSGHVTEGGVAYICERLTIPPAEAYSVATFYALLGTEPRPDTVAHACDDIVCFRTAAEAIPALEATGTTVMPSPCLGACDQPMARLDDEARRPFASGTRLPAVPQPSDARRLLRRVGSVDPSSFEAYLESGGGRALERARDLGPDAVIAEIKASGLRGRGGAAFPIAVKWRGVAEAAGDTKHVIANGDESEPGTFKDRVLMEADPHAVIEGLLIASVATGATHAWVYIRAEYPDAAERLRAAIGAFEDRGLTGDLEIEVRIGAGAYVCGEETALFASIEGQRGVPRQKPPFPTTHGLFRQPTAINNIETLVAAVDVLDRGAATFADEGTPDSTGPKLFCVSGDVARPGVYEFPFGVSLEELVAAAGPTNGVDAVLLGGAAGSFVTGDSLDIPLSFEGAAAAGSTIGSGAVMVFGADTDFGPVVRRIASFFRDESCGECVPCRVGTVRQEESLLRLGSGQPIGSVDHELRLLADLDTAMSESSICGLGRTASSAVRSAIALDLPGVIS